MTKYKHIIFDLDGTLTESRTVITDEMTFALRSLEETHDVVIISGAQKLQMLKQIPWLDDSSFTIMGQSGNDVTRFRELIFRNILSFEDIRVVFSHLEKLHEGYGIDNGVDVDSVEMRGGQISWSPVGHNAPKKIKTDYDPDGAKRREMLNKFPFNNENMMVRIGGTTCLDYTKVGFGKKGNLERLFDLNGWKFEDSVYIGDQIYEGGNDKEVEDIMLAIPINGPMQTLDVIKKIQG